VKDPDELDVDRVEGLSMRFVRLVFRVAGIYGVLLIAPMYFLEDRVGSDYPPPINHAEYYYGFVACCLAWQLTYLLISFDPVRSKLVMVLGGWGKLSFFISSFVLYRQDRLAGSMMALATTDLVLVILFLVAWLRTPSLEGEFY